MVFFMLWISISWWTDPNTSLKQNFHSSVNTKQFVLKQPQKDKPKSEVNMFNKI